MTPKPARRKPQTDEQRERARDYKKGWHEKNPNWQRDHDLWRHYKLTPADWDALLASQDGCCAICFTPEPGGRWGTWHVDHCHDSNKVRGLLCDKCNRGLGFFKDSAASLRAAATYIERFECQTTNSIPLTSETDGRPKHSLPTAPNESKQAGWSAGML